jgi:hypothetical protein
VWSLPPLRPQRAALHQPPKVVQAQLAVVVAVPAVVAVPVVVAVPAVVAVPVVAAVLVVAVVGRNQDLAAPLEVPNPTGVATGTQTPRGCFSFVRTR